MAGAAVNHATTSPAMAEAAAHAAAPAHTLRTARPSSGLPAARTPACLAPRRLCPAGPRGSDRHRGAGPASAVLPTPRIAEDMARRGAAARAAGPRPPGAGYDGRGVREVSPLDGLGLRAGFAGLVQALADAARSHYGPNLVALAVFGSVARGTPGPESDVDVLVICRRLPPGRMRRLEGFAPVEAALEPRLTDLRRRGIHTCLSPVILTAAEAREGSRLFLDMTRHALILHDPDGFLEGLLARLRGGLQAARARRVDEGSRWHWDLGPPRSPGRGGLP